MTPSQRDEDLKAYDEWRKSVNAPRAVDVWLAARDDLRERVKREEPTLSEVLAVLRGKECGDGMFDTVVAFLEEHFKTTPKERGQAKQGEVR